MTHAMLVGATDGFHKGVMPGLVPGIHVLLSNDSKNVDGRDKPGHDGEECWIQLPRGHMRFPCPQGEGEPQPGLTLDLSARSSG
jgi:hypothetical protein